MKLETEPSAMLFTPGRMLPVLRGTEPLALAYGVSMKSPGVSLSNFLITLLPRSDSGVGSSIFLSGVDGPTLLDAASGRFLPTMELTPGNPPLCCRSAEELAEGWFDSLLPLF